MEDNEPDEPNESIFEESKQSTPQNVPEQEVKCDEFDLRPEDKEHIANIKYLYSKQGIEDMNNTFPFEKKILISFHHSPLELKMK